MSVAGIYPVVTLQELEDVKNNLLVLVVVSVLIRWCLSMECALILLFRYDNNRTL